VLGYVNNVSELMDAADLYLTKPGGISVSEATAKGLPMVLINAVAGCEQYNLKYCLERGMAKTADTPEQLSVLCAELLSDTEALAGMRQQIERYAHNDAAKSIFEQLTRAKRQER
jgi:processive 1,2-diacylglycerol beta-glucosyltransferase